MAAPSLARPIGSYRQIVWRQFRHNPGAMFGVVMLGGLVLLAIVGPWLAPYDPIDMNLRVALQPPSSQYLLGTDELGRDIVSRLLAGARITLLITCSAVFLGVLVGSTLGIAAGYYGGWVEDALMRLMDVLLALPGFLLAIAIVAILGAGAYNVVIAVAVASVPVFGRLVRASTLSVREQDYVLAARALGSDDGRMMARHILPNVAAPILVQTSLNLATSILTAAGLSFLGLGPQPPTPEWGAMLSAGRHYIQAAPSLGIIPGLAILLAAVSFNLVGDGLRDALDPRLKS